MFYPTGIESINEWNITTSWHISPIIITLLQENLDFHNYQCEEIKVLFFSTLFKPDGGAVILIDTILIPSLYLFCMNHNFLKNTASTEAELILFRSSLELGLKLFQRVFSKWILSYEQIIKKVTHRCYLFKTINKRIWKRHFHMLLCKCKAR